MWKKGIKKRTTTPNVTIERPKTYPIFCFRHIHRDCHFSVLEKKIVYGITTTLHQLSKMDWHNINTMPRENWMEKISTSDLKKTLPSNFIDLEFVYSIRASSSSRIIWTINNYWTFHILFLDPTHSLY